jgi:hypothetical protein
LSEAADPLVRIVNLRSEQEPPAGTSPGAGRRQSTRFRARSNRREPTNETVRSSSSAPDTDETQPVIAPQAPVPTAAGSLAPPASAAPSVPAVVAPGTIDAKGLKATIFSHSGEVQACSERARMDRPDLHGRVTVRATVGPSGNVISASATNSLEGGARLQSCIVSAFQTWTFPAPAGGVNGSVS